MRREVKWTLTAVVTILVVEVFVLPRLGGGRKSLHLLSHFNIAFALTGLVIEAAALVAFAQLTHAVLPSGILRRTRILQIDLSTLAVSHVMPGGTAFGAALMYRLMTQEGVRAADAGFAIAMQGVGSAVVLNVIFWIALVISLFSHAYNPLYAVAAVFPSTGLWIRNVSFGQITIFHETTKLSEPARRLVQKLPCKANATSAPKPKSEACQNARSLVLPELLKVGIDG